MNILNGEFGSAMKVTIFSLKGTSSEPQCIDINNEILSTINMHTDGMKHCSYFYPTPNGNGGSGLTLFQPLVESFIAWDIWTDLMGAYLFLVSCKEYDINTITKILEKYYKISEIQTTIAKI